MILLGSNDLVLIPIKLRSLTALLKIELFKYSDEKPILTLDVLKFFILFKSIFFDKKLNSSFLSKPINELYINALSYTFFVIGPTVSKKLDIGMTPVLLILPTVGLSPTKEFFDDGDKIDPDVSDPNEAIAKFAAIETPLPELDPPDSQIKDLAARCQILIT